MRTDYCQSDVIGSNFFVKTKGIKKKIMKPLIILGMSSVIIYRESQERRLERVK